MHSTLFDTITVLLLLLLLLWLLLLLLLLLVFLVLYYTGGDWYVEDFRLRPREAALRWPLPDPGAAKGTCNIGALINSYLYYFGGSLV